MIYKVHIIDADSGISFLEATFKDLKNVLSQNDNIQDKIIKRFFNAVNKSIDNVQDTIVKEKKVNEMTRVLESEESTTIIYHHPLSRAFFCSISDADDDIDKIKYALLRIANRFWKKHKSNIKIFRTTTEKEMFQTFLVDIENLTLGGRIAEVFPKILIDKNVLERILSIGTITESEFKVAMKCDGRTSSLKISRFFNKSRSKIDEILKKLEELDIIKT